MGRNARADRRRAPRPHRARLEGCRRAAGRWILLPRTRAPVAALVAGIVFSTVYLSFHYVADVIGGIVLAATVIWALPEIRSRAELDSAPSSRVADRHRSRMSGGSPGTRPATKETP